MASDSIPSEEFYDEIDRVMHPQTWGHNLDAFNDILRGGFGTPEEGFTLRWKNHSISKARLGYPAFDWLIEIIRKHGRGGEEEQDCVELVLD